MSLYLGELMNQNNARSGDVLPIHINERKAADTLGVSVKSLRRWRYQRSGPPYVKLRHLIRYSVQDLQNWMAGQKVFHQQ